jgi:mannose-6-phosphate isomerase-like protein (cupin superfamily)
VSLTTPVPDAAGGQNPQNGSLYVPAGTGVTKWSAGDVYTIKASATTTNGSFGFVEASVPPGGGPVAHVHRRSDEAFYLMYGELELLTGDRIFTARSGDFIFVHRGTRHRFRNTGLHTANDDNKFITEMLTALLLLRRRRCRFSTSTALSYVWLHQHCTVQST